MKKIITALLSMAFLSAVFSGTVLPVRAMASPTTGSPQETMMTAVVTIKGVSPTNPVVGQPVIVSFEVSGQEGSPLPTGSVTIGDSLTTATCAGNLTVDETNQVSRGSCPVRLYTAGSHNLTATYSGDSFYETSASDPRSLMVNKAATGIDSFSVGGTLSLGQTLTAEVILTVKNPGSGEPTGGVVITDELGHVYCSVTLFENSHGTCSFTADFMGTKNFTASYAGDSNYEGSLPQSFEVTIGKATPVITLAANPAASAVVGQDVQVTVTVTGAVGYPPTGLVSIRYDNGQSCPSVNLVNGTGSCTINFSSPGWKTLTIGYPGDDHYLQVTQSSYYEVDPAGAIPVILSANPSPSLPDQPFTINFEVTAQAPGSGTPTGSVVIKEGEQTLCLVDLPSTSCTGTIHTTGAYALTASYSGDTNFNSGVSAPFSHLVSFGDTYADPTGTCGGNAPCYRSFQSAILAAAPDRTVTVYPGLYAENVNLNKEVTVSLDGDVTINGSLTIATGAFVSTSGTLSVSGDVFHTGGTFTHNGGILRLFGPARQRLSLGTPIHALTLDKPGPSGYWKFDEGQGTSLADSSPGHLAGTLVNGLSQNGSFTGQQPPTVNYTNQYALLTRPAYVSVSPSSSLGLSDQFSLAAWAFWNGTDEANQVLLSKPYLDSDGAQQTGLSLGLSGGFPALAIFDGSQLRLLSASQAVPVGQWFYLAATYDGQTARIFLDGQEIASQQDGSTHGLVTGDAAFLIGREFTHGAAQHPWDGKVDEVQVYDRALDPAEIAVLSRGEEPVNYVTLGAELALSGDLTLRSGTLDVSQKNYPIVASSNWIREDGTFIPRQAAVTLNGDTQAIRGANTFYHLTRTTPGTLTLQSGQTQTIAGGLTLHGTESRPLSLVGDHPGVQWEINPQGSRDLSDLSVSDSANIHPLRIDATQNGIQGGANNTGWDFYAPTPALLSDSATEDQAKTLTLQADDADGDALTFTITSLPAHGVLYQVEDGKLGTEITGAGPITDPQHRLIYLFTREGPEQVTFDVRVSDGLVDSSATLHLSLVNGNDPPEISMIADQTMNENTSLGPLDFTVMDEETPANDLQVTAASSNTGLIPASGLVLGESGTNRMVQITPMESQVGVAEITLSVQDGGGAITRQVFKVTVNPVNEPPTSADQTVTLAEDTSYTFKQSDFLFSDTHQDTFRGLLIVNTVNAGRLTDEGGALTIVDGATIPDPSRLSFTPAADASGNPYTTFTFCVRDSFGAYSDIYTLTIVVTSVPDAPFAEGDAYVTDEDTPLVISAERGVLANDGDADGDPLEAKLVQPPGLGKLMLNDDGSFTYTPDANACGDDTFTYQASDGQLNSQVATVRIHVNPVDDLPILQINPIAPAKEGDSITLTAAYLDPDTGQTELPAGDSLTWEFGDQSPQVTGGLSASHAFLDNGTFTVQAQITAQSPAASLTVTVENVAPRVSAGEDMHLLMNTPLTRTISFFDPGQDSWTATVDYGDGSGQQSLSLQGGSATLEHTFTHPGSWNVTVTVTDDDGEQGTATFQVMVSDKRFVYLPVVAR